MYFNFRIRVPVFLARFFLWIYLQYQKIRYGRRFGYIPLNNGRFAIVDSADYENLMKYKWHMRSSSEYAVRIEKRKRIYMHNEIMRPSAGLMVDHKDHDSLNNTRWNLRIATKAQNSYNQKKRVGRTSKHKGVYLDRRGYWRAKIRCDGKVIYLGCHKKEEDAAKAYDKAARKYHGDFAVLNFG
ncbi:MAG: HNH endonuclease [Planctomycetes bacterium]|nr:HNH endonuclease [Planctomycetota bacterium]MBU1518137.1 HNH endonuclease [Planctomycetota bacterium]MBU2457215.1 HNH endonuclease [Planctomycetota bacterium]MBU2595937.1 HNH endonuclease [Planctomycetota bacterium]